MPYFAGSPIFGVAVTMALAQNPRAAQTNAYPGLSGVEELDQGMRGAFTVVSGRLVGVDAPSLAAMEAIFRSFNDGNSYTLIDAFGIAWPNVKLESFEPQGRVVASPSIGYHRRYTARFKHLTA